MIQRPNAVGSLFAPDIGEREGWPPQLRALDWTITPAAAQIVGETNQDACGTADGSYNQACRVPARIEAIKRLSRVETVADWPYIWGAVNPGDPETSRGARVALAQAVVVEAGLDAWEYDPSIYLEGGAFSPMVRGATVPGGGSDTEGGVINILIGEEQPAALTARIHKARDCEDMRDDLERGRPLFGGPAVDLSAVDACWAELDAMPYPESADVPGISWKPPGGGLLDKGGNVVTGEGFDVDDVGDTPVDVDDTGVVDVGDTGVVDDGKSGADEDWVEFDSTYGTEVDPPVGVSRKAMIVGGAVGAGVLVIVITAAVLSRTKRKAA